MPTLKQTLSYLILGQKGGANRIRIIDLLADRPYNLNQLAEIMEVNYRTVRHHIDVLVKAELVSSSKAGGAGEVYYLTPQMESNRVMFNEIVRKQTDMTAAPGFFHNVVEQTNHSIIIMDENSEVFFWNKASEELYGWTDEEVQGKPIPIFTDEKTLDDLLEKVGSGGKVVNVQAEAQSKSGERLDVKLSFECVEDENGESVGCSILSEDITLRKKVEDELVQSADLYRSLFESSPDILYVLDPEGTILDVNPETVAKLGYTKEELVGKHLPEVFSPESQKIFMEKFPILLEKGHSEASVELVRKNGSRIPVECKASAARNEKGEIEKIVVSERSVKEE